MKSTARLIDNLMNSDYRKAKVDLKKATEQVMLQRVVDKKNDVIKQYSKK